MKINNRKYELSKRKARDVLVLQEESRSLDLPIDKKITPEQYKNTLVVLAKCLSDSFKATYLNFGLFKKIVYYFRYKKFLKNGSYYILKNLNQTEINEYYDELLELEGTPKKKSPAGKS